MARSCWSGRGPRAGQKSGMERQGTCEIPCRSSGRVPDRAARLIKAQARTRIPAAPGALRRARTQGSLGSLEPNP